MTSCTVPQNLRAKVSDFGMSRLLGPHSRVNTRSTGTVTHAAPELLSEMSGFTKASDVYSFGVLAWEISHHCRAWANLLHAQILVAVVIRKEMLRFDLETHPGFKELAMRCLDQEPSKRPSMSYVAESLNEMRLEALRLVGMPYTPAF
eukprot:jgi/Botrbrau1/2605/Bobra.145_1s0030.2